MAKVFEAFGKPVGRDDFRTQDQRNHDALETALGLSLGVPDLPRSGGLKTQAFVVVSLADLIALDGGAVAAQKWLDAQDEKLRDATVPLPGAYLTAKTGEAGWLSGTEAEAAACAAHVTPVVTGTPDWDVVSDMADVFLEAHGISHALTREARLALERTLLRMAIDALSGPDGLAGFLRARLLDRPFSGASLPLDLGDTDHVPDYLRRAVILRDRKCQWPGGCDRPASQCEPHHLRPRGEGGETSLGNLGLFCLVHHHHFIHRLGWKVTRHPDGTLTATSPRGKTIHSHGPRDGDQRPRGPSSGGPSSGGPSGAGPGCGGPSSQAPPGTTGPSGTTGPPETTGHPGSPAA